MAATTQRIEIHLTAEERALEEAAANAKGVSLSEFVRDAALSEAERVMDAPARIVVDKDAAQRFLQALEQEGRHVPGLKRLLEKPSVIAPQ